MKDERIILTLKRHAKLTPEQIAEEAVELLEALKMASTEYFNETGSYIVLVEEAIQKAES